MPPEIPQYRPQEQIVRRRQALSYKMWQEESEGAPSFTFLLRPRVIQCHQTCKLLCCLSGKPTPTVKWFKGNKELTKSDYTMSHADGVVTIEIVNCKPGDSGKYKCVATNHLGTDETSCVVIVEGRSSAASLSPYFDILIISQELLCYICNSFHFQSAKAIVFSMQRKSYHIQSVLNFHVAKLLPDIFVFD